MFWIEADPGGYTGTVKKALLDGGSLTTIASGENEPYDIVADGANVYWTTLGEVKKASVDGGPATAIYKVPPLYTGAASWVGPGPIAVDSTSVYWRNRGPIEGAIAKLTPK